MAIVVVVAVVVAVAVAVVVVFCPFSIQSATKRCSAGLWS